MHRNDSDHEHDDLQPLGHLALAGEERTRLLAALSAVWAVPRASKPRAHDVEQALTELTMILGAHGEATDVADYLFYQGAEMLGGAQPHDRVALRPLAEALVRIHQEVWARAPSV